MNDAQRSRVQVVHLEPLLTALATDQSPSGLGWHGELLVEQYFVD